MIFKVLNSYFFSPNFLSSFLKTKLQLAEDSPDNLLQIYEKPNLESVFLHLCLSDSTERGDLDESPNK